jgi:hypothetical protein
LIASHELFRKNIVEDHKEELAELEEQMRKELNEDFNTCEFVVEACHFCSVSENDYPSIKCAYWFWPMMCSSVTTGVGRKIVVKASTGFVNIVSPCLKRV